ncbi:hypothetical protein DFJ43DRAFT_1105087 [Lentinula guzmanii]|uniref:Uncharacterized protein n=1 Tax=Lentinula guzmanii TaxID=2804957 RepID=A0AA38JA48_9AGAR|nr:hypothetical protein DFJ43DRAFT_1105087 [Lentinula guzmanii]
MTVLLGWEGTSQNMPLATHSEVDQPSLHTTPSESRFPSRVKSERQTPPTIQLLPEPEEEPAVEYKYGWKHPAELQYYTPEDWSLTKIIFHLIANAFSIPPRAAVRGSTPFFVVTGIRGETTRLPIGYRVPLMFLASFQWSSLQLVLTASSRETEWVEYRFSILHVSRLCSTLLNAAQDYVRVSNEGISKGMDRKWRCPTFDRALARYRLKWFISSPSQVEEFWHTFQEEVYKKDVIKFDWRRWALKGHRGFMLTDDDISNGVSAEQFISGLKQKNDDWFWETKEGPVSNGIDAWSLRTLALSVSTPMSDLPTTYSQASSALPDPTPTTPSTITSSDKLPRLPCEPVTDSSPKYSEAIPSSVENESKTNSFPNSVGDLQSSHANGMITASSQRINLRKRHGSPLEKEEYRIISKRNSRNRQPNPALVYSEQDTETHAGESLNVGNGIGVDSTLFSSSTPSNSSLRAPDRSNNMIIDESVVPRISISQRVQHRPYTNGDIVSTAPSELFSNSGSLSAQQQMSNPLTFPDSHSTTGPSDPFQPFSAFTSSPSHQAPASDNPSAKAIIHVIDNIYASFTDSLSRFSGEIRLAKAESVSEIRETLTSTFLNKKTPDQIHHPTLEATIRNVVREEIRKAIQEESASSSLKKEILDATQQEVRDGVRVLVATIRTEVVEQLVDQNNALAKQLSDIQHPLPSVSRVGISTAHQHGGTSRKPTGKQVNLDGPVQRINHPLQHLLGEPEDADLSGDHDDEVGNESDENLSQGISARMPADHSDNQIDGSFVCAYPADDILPCKSRRKLGL